MLTTFFLVNGPWQATVCCGLALILSLIHLVKVTRRPINMMTTFAEALDMGDTTMSFNLKGDEDLNRLSRILNRLTDTFRDNNSQLETRKLYYDRILSVMTHEMRNSITPIISLSEYLANKPETLSKEEISEALSLIESQAKGIKRFLDAYYNLTHLPVPSLESIRARDFMTRLKNVADAELSQRGLPAATITYISAQDLQLRIDEELMRQAMVNLIRNALDASCEEHSDKDVGSSPSVKISLSSGDDIAIIRISDNGGGIPRTVMDNLFQPFLTTKHGGSGVGLTLSRQIARLHGGDLKVSSSSPHGTTLTLTLPKDKIM